MLLMTKNKEIEKKIPFKSKKLYSLLLDRKITITLLLSFFVLAIFFSFSYDSSLGIFPGIESSYNLRVAEHIDNLDETVDAVFGMRDRESFNRSSLHVNLFNFVLSYLLGLPVLLFKLIPVLASLLVLILFYSFLV